jgi:hypothetical protein
MWVAPSRREPGPVMAKGCHMGRIDQPGKSVTATESGAEGAFDPISGVTLERYTAIIRQLGARGNDHALLPEIAAASGIAAADWEVASHGWGARIKTHRAVGSKFNALYTSA